MRIARLPWAAHHLILNTGTAPNYGPNYSSGFNKHSICFLIFQRLDGEPGWDRTNDHLIKSQMLYR